MTKTDSANVVARVEGKWKEVGGGVAVLGWGMELDEAF